MVQLSRLRGFFFFFLFFLVGGRPPGSILGGGRAPRGSSTHHHNHARALLLLPFVHAQALSTPPTRLRQRSTRRSAASTAAPTQSNAYRLASAASVAAWSACAVTALSRHPTLALPAAHARLSILQALTPLPLLTASFEAAPDDRTVQLGLAAASAWLCAAVVFAPRFTATAAARAPGLAHMAHSAAITYPAPLRAVAAAVHAGAALLCGAAYASSPNTKRSSQSTVWRGVAAPSRAGRSSRRWRRSRSRRCRRCWAGASRGPLALFQCSTRRLRSRSRPRIKRVLRRGVARAAAAHWVAVGAKLVWNAIASASSTPRRSRGRSRRSPRAALDGGWRAGRLDGADVAVHVPARPSRSSTPRSIAEVGRRGVLAPRSHAHHDHARCVRRRCRWARRSRSHRKKVASDEPGPRDEQRSRLREL